jgi:S-adenosylmethionine decarboxylase
LERFGFGLHLLADGYKARAEQLQDAALLRATLERLSSDLSLTRLSQPEVFDVHGTMPTDGGLTGMIAISDGHIVVHTFPQKGFVHCNIFSPRDLETETALKTLTDAFGIGRLETRLMNRGKQLPLDSSEAQRVLLGDRDYLETRIA